MSYRKSKSLRHQPLPIAGSTVVDIATRPGIGLMFRAREGLLSRIVFEQAVLLSRPDGDATLITSTRPGLTFDSDAALRELSPLIGAPVTRAVAHSDGRLEIIFADG